ncbi:MAG: hypothetical protein NTZ85_01130 [Bacteroidia bacterium]|nr:hypothetical protein [Bacteroidia bacterium]
MRNSMKVVLIAILFKFCCLDIIYCQSVKTNHDIRVHSGEYNSIKETLERPWGKLFYIERINGRYKMGDTVSHFDKNKNFEALTFDISNNKVLANIGVQGSIKSLTVYRDTYFANCTPTSGLTDGSWPGVWAAKDNSSYGPYSFTLDLNGQTYDLDKVPWDFRTGLLDNIIPVTEFKGPEGQFTIKVVTFAPISQDGKERIRGAVYGLYLENRSENNLAGTINLPKLMQGNRKDLSLMNTGALSWATLDPYDFDLALGDTENSKIKVKFDLKKGENIWVPAILYNLGDPALQEINKMGTLVWLNNTLQYFRSLLGKLETPQDPYLAEFFERQVIASFGAIGMSESGKIAGSNWGSYPATRQIWMKDFYYSSLPFTILDKEMAQKLILWFSEFGVRPKGSILEGGVNHSVGISMASLMLAGLYYQNSGDKQFFIQNIQLKKYWEKILSELISSRKDPDIWLFPSRYISDGYILPDYHTGSNVCAWFALKSYSRLLREVYNEPDAGTFFEETAAKVHSAIMEKCTISGPFGNQFIEATYHDGRPAPMESDGEESDITLMPLYGFLSWDDPVYLNYMKFSVSEYNTIYRPKIYAISWYDTPSTAPGYMKGVCAGTDKSSLFGEHGSITEIRKVTDADGSIWWWVYGWGERSVTPPYGKVVRGNPGGFGKSGWFSGIYSTVFITRQLGLSYDRAKNTMHFAPIMPSSGFEWNDISLDDSKYSINYKFDSQSVTVNLKNTNPVILSTEFSLPVLTIRKGFQTYVNGKLFSNFNLKKYLNQDYVSLPIEIPENGEVKIQLLNKGLRPK